LLNDSQNLFNWWGELLLLFKDGKRHVMQTVRQNLKAKYTMNENWLQKFNYGVD
jgi:hypothetical protein